MMCPRVSQQAVSIQITQLLLQCHCCYLCLQCFDAVGWVAGRASNLQKTEWWGAGVVTCLERGADLHTAQLMPLPLTVSCFSEIQIGFTFLVPAYPGSSGHMAVKRMCVCVCVTVAICMKQNTGGYAAVAKPDVLLSLNHRCQALERTTDNRTEQTQRQNTGNLCRSAPASHYQ